MNIIEAIKSGKPFKKKNELGGFFTPDDMTIFFKDTAVRARGQWLIGDDFEIQEKQITITESQFDEAWDKYAHRKDMLYMDKDNFKKELGF